MSLRSWKKIQIPPSLLEHFKKGKSISYIFPVKFNPQRWDTFHWRCVDSEGIAEVMQITTVKDSGIECCIKMIP